MTPTPADFDAITLDALRSGGGLKWSTFPNAIGAFVAEMDFGTAPAVEEALHRAVRDAVFGYLPAAVSTAMSEATASWLSRAFSWTVAPDRIHPIPDVIAGLDLAMEHFSAPDSPVILPTPAYMPFLTVPPLRGRELIQVPLLETGGRYALDLEAIDEALAARGGLLVLCNPYNPVGRVFSREELLALSEVVERRGARVFSDEIHAPLVYAGSSHVPYASVSDAAAAHTVTATSASKAWNLPGLKCAQFIVSNDADAKVWEGIGPMASHGASNFGVIANTAAYTDGVEWLDDVRGYLDGNRMLLAELLAAHLPGVRYTPPEGTYIAWLDWREYDLGAAPAEFLLQNAGVALTDGALCGAPGAGFTRLVFATPRPVLERAVEQLADAAAGRRRPTR